MENSPTNKTKFPSKVLLFGEHIVNKGAHALAIPFSKFYGQLSFDRTHPDYFKESGLVLKKLHAHIYASSELKPLFNLQELEMDILNGIGLHLNIPVGYGLGSSGAIVAALFERYAYSTSLAPLELRNILGLTEGVFHGKSSGLDPLVSYLNKTILVKDGVNIIDNELQWKSEFEIFLVDTGTPRKTGPLVEAFLQKSANHEFAQVLNESMIPINNSIISNFITNNHQDSLKQLKQLSKLQLKYIPELILPQHTTWFQAGIDSDDYCLKICGAGGGGFMLGFTKSKDILFPFTPIWLS